MLKEKQDIINWLDKNQVKNYWLVEDSQYGFVVDVEGSVRLSAAIEVKFNKVRGNFSCYDAGLTTLLGAPDFVSGDFNCSNNNLTSLMYAPKVVQGSFYCNSNQLTSLVGIPNVEGRSLDCSNNKIVSLRECPKILSKLNCRNNQILSLMGGPEQCDDFDCSNNQLTDLVSGPLKVTTVYNCRNNKISSFAGIPVDIKSGTFYCGFNTHTVGDILSQQELDAIREMLSLKIIEAHKPRTISKL